MMSDHAPDQPFIALHPRLRTKSASARRPTPVEDQAAELGAEILCTDLDLALEPRENHGQLDCQL